MLGLVRNRPHQPAASVGTEDGYTLSIVEFDDQGLCYRRGQMDALSAALTRLQGQAPVLVAFAHGWKHDGRSDDTNLASFKAILKHVAWLAADRPVLGVFIAWRGMTWHGVGIENLTFWGRQEAATRVSVGSARELLGRLRQFRDGEIGAHRGEPVLVIVGHSFGGLLIYSAVAQSLIEAAATPAGTLLPSFANLIVLVNPAFAAVRYLPIQDQVEGHAFNEDQPPVFAAVTAANDWATGVAFPIGELIPTVSESTLTRRERYAILATIGHMRSLRTHTLAAIGKPTARRQQQRPSPPETGATPYDAVPQQRPHGACHFRGGAILTPMSNYRAHDPYWIVRASPEVVDGHNGIFGQVFCDFLCGLVISHLQHAAARDGRRRATAQAHR